MKTIMRPHESGLFRVVRAFWLAGRVVQPGGTVELSDPHLIIELLANGKIYAANALTQSRIKPAPSSWSEPGQRKPFDPAIPTGMAVGIAKR